MGLTFRRPRNPAALALAAADANIRREKSGSYGQYSESANPTNIGSLANWCVIHSIDSVLFSANTTHKKVRVEVKRTRKVSFIAKPRLVHMPSGQDAPGTPGPLPRTLHPAKLKQPSVEPVGSQYAAP